MPLDPQARQLLEVIAKLNLPAPSSLSAEAARAQSAATARALPPGPDVAVVERSLQLPSHAIALREYRPHASAGRVLPAVVNFHGGGFVTGSLDQSDADCRRLADAVGCSVVSVDYRLAPEHKFPAGLEDAYAATRYVSEHAAALQVDSGRIAVMGDSAGANLAAGVARIACERGAPRLCYQLLIYPITDLTNFATRSYLEYDDGFFLTRAKMQWFARHYLASPADASNPLVSPLLAADLTGLPHASVITAEYDPLCDEGDAYARRLQAAGVPTQHKCYPGMFHGFFTLSPFLDVGKQASADAAQTLRQAFGLE